jgi:hypothetical protein
MLKKTFYFFVFTVLSSTYVFADELVYDPTNYVENAATAVQTLAIQGSTAATVAQLVQEYQMFSQDLKQLENIGQYLKNLDITQNLNSYYGTTPLSQLATLDPNSANYAQQRDNILAQYFQKPTDPNAIQAEFQSALTQNDIDAIKNKTQAENMNYQILQDSIDESTNAQDKAKKRQSNISDYQGALNSGDLSQLKIEQTTGLELNTALEQNEQNIAMQNEALKYLRMQKSYEDSEMSKESQAQESSLERAINQGTSGLGRSSWGDF